jgi:hypothetical protein
MKGWRYFCHPRARQPGCCCALLAESISEVSTIDATHPTTLRNLSDRDIFPIWTLAGQDDWNVVLGVCLHPHVYLCSTLNHAPMYLLHNDVCHPTIPIPRLSLFVGVRGAGNWILLLLIPSTIPLPSSSCKAPQTTACGPTPKFVQALRATGCKS